MAKNTIAKFPKGADIQLTKNFSLREYQCKCDSQSCDYTLVDLDLIVKLQELRDTMKIPLRVTSGYRCETHNAIIGGSPTSQHKLGTAADIVPLKGTLQQVYDAASAIFDGIGTYNNFIHLDVRGYRARWNVTKLTKGKENK